MKIIGSVSFTEPYQPGSPAATHPVVAKFVISHSRWKFWKPAAEAVEARASYAPPLNTVGPWWTQGGLLNKKLAVQLTWLLNDVYPGVVSHGAAGVDRHGLPQLRNPLPPMPPAAPPRPPATKVEHTATIKEPTT